MNFTFAHNNLNVYDLDASLRFYKEALGLTVTRTKEADDGSFKLVYLGDSTTPHKLELTWLRDMDRPYNLGDNEIHLAFETDDFDAAHEKHKELCQPLGLYSGLGRLGGRHGKYMDVPLPPRPERRRGLSYSLFSFRRTLRLCGAVR